MQRPPLLGSREQTGWLTRGELGVELTVGLGTEQGTLSHNDPMHSV